MNELQCYVGCYTQGGPDPASATGEGIVGFRLNTDTGAITTPVLLARCANPSWVCVSPDGRTLAAVEELGHTPGKLHSFAIAADGALAALTSVPAPGAATCHLAYTRQGLAAASYRDGTMSVHSQRDDQLLPAVVRHAYTGSGPNRQRQESAHAHQVSVSPDGRWLVVCDLGSDRLYVHDLHDLQVPLVHSISTPAGSGPRHAAWIAGALWCWCELQPLLLVYTVATASGHLELSAVHDLEQVAPGIGAGGGIASHPRSPTLLALSERRGDSALILQLDADRTPRLLARIPAPGPIPRFLAFTPEGNWLMIASQGGHSIALHRCHGDTIEESATTTCSTPSPCCVATLVR